MARLLRITVLCCFMVFVAGLFSSLAAADNKSEIIKPSGIHEDCMELVPGDTLDYSFNASKPLDFNVHYHEDRNVVYVVTKDGASSDKGAYRCEKKQYYCLMWTNPGSESVSLTYSYGIKKK